METPRLTFVPRPPPDVRRHVEAQRTEADAETDLLLEIGQCPHASGTENVPECQHRRADKRKLTRSKGKR